MTRADGYIKSNTFIEFVELYIKFALNSLSLFWMIAQQRTRFWIYHFAFFFLSKLGNSEIKTSNHNTTQPKWNIWLLNQHSTEGTGGSFNSRTQTHLWWHGVRGNLQYWISRIMCSIRLKRQCVALKAAFGGSNRCSTYCTWSSTIYTWMVCDRKNTRGNLQSWLQIFVSKKRKKKKGKEKQSVNIMLISCGNKI